MRKLAEVLTILAAITFVLGVARIFFWRLMAGVPYMAATPETYWRGATGLLLFAIVLLMLERSKAR